MIGYCVEASCPCHTTPPSARRPRGLSPHRDARKAGLTCCERCWRRGDKPLTVVSPPGAVSLQEIAGRVVQSREQHGALLNDYHKVWYESGHTWAFTFFLGVGMMKCPNDLWVYQDLLTRVRPTTIIETGTYAGASALWFAHLMDMLKIRGGRVITIDIHDHRPTPKSRVTHPRITYLRGSSVDPATVRRALARRQRGPLLICLDSDHSEAHVLRELELYAPHTVPGDVIVVEDTNIGWVGPDGKGGDRGARGGVEDYLALHPGEFVQDILCERYLLTMNPGGWLVRVQPHQNPEIAVETRHASRVRR